MVCVGGLRLHLVGPKSPASGLVAGSVRFESSVSVSRRSCSYLDGDVVVWRVSASESSGIYGGVYCIVSTSEISKLFTCGEPLLLNRSGTWREGLLDAMSVVKVWSLRSEKALGKELFE